MKKDFESLTLISVEYYCKVNPACFKCFQMIHTKNDNYKDNDISVHTSERYRLFILSACASAVLNSRTHYNKIDSDWVISWKKIVLKVIPTISFVCAFIVIVVVWNLLFFHIENDF